VWVVPSDFGSALQGFTKMLGAPGEDGVFRYQPSPVEDNLPKPEDDTDEVADWFTTRTDPDIAMAVAKAEAEARTPVQGPGYTPPPPLSPPPLSPPPPPGAITAPVTRDGGGGAHAL
jgi:hypothetical protein